MLPPMLLAEPSVVDASFEILRARFDGETTLGLVGLRREQLFTARDFAELARLVRAGYRRDDGLLAAAIDRFVNEGGAVRAGDA